MSGVVVIVAYRPKPGKENELIDLVRSRVPTLRKEGLVSDRVPTIMRSRDGTASRSTHWPKRTRCSQVSNRLPIEHWTLPA